MEERTEMESESGKAIFAAGCFWGIEAAFRKVEGVSDALCGYIGGHVDNPTYEQVCSGATEHAEGVLLTYDPAVATYEDLLEVFWKIHDPTQVNRQGPDVGRQYRTAIFHLDEDQRQKAEASKSELESRRIYNKPIATEVVAATRFWPAEDYHQRFLEKRSLFRR